MFPPVPVLGLAADELKVASALPVPFITTFVEVAVCGTKAIASALPLGIVDGTSHLSCIASVPVSDSGVLNVTGMSLLPGTANVLLTEEPALTVQLVRFAPVVPSLYPNESMSELSVAPPVGALAVIVAILLPVPGEIVEGISMPTVAVGVVWADATPANPTRRATAEILPIMFIRSDGINTKEHVANVPFKRNHMCLKLL